MTGAALVVSPEWLSLREPADVRARSTELVAELRQALPRDGVLVIHDLACGTGAMGRWLAPMLAGCQRWVLHDWDAGLLAVAGADVPVGHDGEPLAVEPRRSDIRSLRPADVAGASLITASALLDLITSDDLDRVVSLCASVRCPVLMTLSVTGGVALEPSDPLDTRVAAAFNAHQRRATSRGRLLGPDAAEAAAEAFGREGFDVVARPSPWTLGPGDAELLAEWFAGWLAAACEQEPALPYAGYRARRLADLAGGRLRATIDHVDLLALPR